MANHLTNLNDLLIYCSFVIFSKVVYMFDMLILVPLCAFFCSYRNCLQLNKLLILSVPYYCKFWPYLGSLSRRQIDSCKLFPYVKPCCLEKKLEKISKCRLLKTLHSKLNVKRKTQTKCTEIVHIPTCAQQTTTDDIFRCRFSWHVKG